MNSLLRNSDSIARAGCILLLAVVITMGWATRSGAFRLGTEPVKHPQISDVELPESPEELAGLLQLGTPAHRPVAERIRANMAWDSYFPAVYSLCFLSLVLFVLGLKPPPAALVTGTFAAAAIVVTVVFDYRENAGLIKLLDIVGSGAPIQISQLPALIEPMSRASLSKWAWLGVSLMLLGLAEVLARCPGIPFKPASALRILSAFSGGVFGIATWALHARNLSGLELLAFAVVVLTVLISSNKGDSPIGTPIISGT